MLEHPARPRWREYAPTIWKTGFMQWLLASPAFKTVYMEQGVHGQKSKKPTELLALRLPGLQHFVSQRQVPKGMYHEPEDEADGLPSCGLGPDGKWRTASLKAYPPSMNCAIAKAIHQAIACRHRQGLAAGETPDEEDIASNSKLSTFMTSYDPYGGGVDTQLRHSDYFKKRREESD